MFALLLLVSLCLALGRSNCPKGSFLVKETDSQRCCKSCPEGARMVAVCTANQTTICRPCQIGEYMHPATLVCFPCTECTEGYGVISDCVLRKNTECQQCPQGTFSNTTSSTEGCEKCSSCPIGYSKAQNCSANQDTICNLSPNTFTSTVAYDQSTARSHITSVNTRKPTKNPQKRGITEEILIVVIVATLIVIIFIFILLCYWKKVLCFRPDVTPANHRRDSRRGLIATRKAQESVKGDTEEGTSL